MRLNCSLFEVKLYDLLCCILILDVLDFVLFEGAQPYMSPGGPRPGQPGQRPPFMPPHQSPGMRPPYQGMSNIPHGQTPAHLGTPSSQPGGPYPRLPGSPTPYPGMHASLPPQSAQQVAGNKVMAKQPQTLGLMEIHGPFDFS